jgi:hypothetical protein
MKPIVAYLATLGLARAFSPSQLLQRHVPKSATRLFAAESSDESNVMNKYSR